MMKLVKEATIRDVLCSVNRRSHLMSHLEDLHVIVKSNQQAWKRVIMRQKLDKGIKFDDEEECTDRLIMSSLVILG